MTTYTDIVIPHKTREDRRAVWHKSERTISYEYLSGNDWKPDYTIWEDSIERDDYFKKYYGVDKVIPGFRNLGDG